MSTGLAKKLEIKTGQRVLVLGAPEGYAEVLGVDAETKANGTFDVVQLFVRSSGELDRTAPRALRALKSGGVLWASYPKRSAKVATDITRDRGWDALVREGWRPVSQVAIDDIWSALRFRPSADVRSSRTPPAAR